MTWLAQIPEYDHEVDTSDVFVEQRIRTALRDATRSSQSSGAANAVLKQFDGKLARLNAHAATLIPSVLCNQ